MANVGVPLILWCLAAIGVGLALVAGALVRWLGREALGRHLLVAACGLGSLTLAWGAIGAGRGPLVSPWVALAGIALATGWWSLALPKARRGLRAVCALVVALGLGGYLLGGGVSWRGWQAEGALFGIADGFYVFAAGALVLGGIATVGSEEGSQLWPLSMPDVALVLWGVALLAQGAAAQAAWGSYFSWDPIECWRLLGGLVIAMIGLGIHSLGWRGRPALIAQWVGIGLVLGVLLGAMPLVGWLGLGSLYRVG